MTYHIKRARKHRVAHIKYAKKLQRDQSKLHLEWGRGVEALLQVDEQYISECLQGM